MLPNFSIVLVNALRTKFSFEPLFAAIWQQDHALIVLHAPCFQPSYLVSLWRWPALVSRACWRPSPNWWGHLASNTPLLRQKVCAMCTSPWRSFTCYWSPLKPATSWRTSKHSDSLLAWWVFECSLKSAYWYVIIWWVNDFYCKISRTCFEPDHLLWTMLLGWVKCVIVPTVKDKLCMVFPALFVFINQY